jgi:serine/threonine protein kinase
LIDLADYGMAREFSIEKSRTQSNNIGTLLYMSPEMIDDVKYKFLLIFKFNVIRGPNCSSDIWSLGIIFHLLIEPIYPFNQGTPFHIQKMITTGKILNFQSDIPSYLTEFRNYILNVVW